MEKDSPISVRSLERQINREGERWHLVADIDEDFGVGVAEVIHRAEVHHGLGEIVRDGRWRLCTLSDEHPFSAVLGNRIRNGETDITHRYKERRRREKIAANKALDARKEQARAIWRTRKTITALPTGIVPAGLRERQRRRED